MLTMAKAKRRLPGEPPLDLHPVVKRLRKLRLSQQQTQEAFAVSLRISLSTLRSWEQGRIVPDKTTLSFVKLWLDIEEKK